MEKDLKKKSRYEIPKLEVLSDVLAEGAAICGGTGSGAAACDASGSGATACSTGSSATAG